MHFEGTRDFALPADALYEKLADAAFLARSLTDVTVVRTSADESEWKARPALTFLAGTLDNKLTISDRQPPSAIRYSMFSKGIGASSTVAIALRIVAAEGGSRVEWAADITALTGLLKLAPQALLVA